MRQADADAVDADTFDCVEGRPFVVTDAQARRIATLHAPPNPDTDSPQARWRARETTSLQFLRDAFPDEQVLCCDKARAAAALRSYRAVRARLTRCLALQAPFRTSDEPPAQTLNVTVKVCTRVQRRRLESQPSWLTAPFVVSCCSPPLSRRSL